MKQNYILSFLILLVGITIGYVLFSKQPEIKVEIPPVASSCEEEVVEEVFGVVDGEDFCFLTIYVDRNNDEGSYQEAMKYKLYKDDCFWGNHTYQGYYGDSIESITISARPYEPNENDK